MVRKIKVQGHHRKAHDVKTHYRKAPSKKEEEWWEWPTPTTAVLRKGKRPKKR